MKNNWTRVAGKLSIELWWADPEPSNSLERCIWPVLKWFRRPMLYLDGHDPNELSLDCHIEDGDELVIEFESTGYYDPGVRSGPVDKCYPPEGEDDREVIDIYILRPPFSRERIIYRIPKSLWPTIEELCRDEIEDVEIDRV